MNRSLQVIFSGKRPLAVCPQPLARLAAFLLLLVLSACSGKGDPAASDHAHDTPAKTVATTATVELTPEQAQAADLKYGDFEPRKLKSLVLVNGRLIAPPMHQASVTTAIGGQVQAISVIESEHVKAGQTLAVLQSLEALQLQQDYLEAQSQLAFAQAELARVQELKAANVSSDKQLQQATSDQQTLTARVAALRAKLQLVGLNPDNVTPQTLTSKLVISSPINGQVRMVGINLGAYAQPNQPLFELVNSGHLHAELHVFAQDALRIEPGQKVELTLPNTQGVKLTGTLITVSNAFDDVTKTIPVHAELDNPAVHLPSGVYVKGSVATGEAQPVPALPDDAVYSDGQQHYIFVRPNGQALQFQRVPVSVGGSEGGYTEVRLPDTYTLPKGAQVVLSGAYYLQAALSQAEGGDDHGH